MYCRIVHLEPETFAHQCHSNKKNSSGFRVNCLWLLYGVSKCITMVPGSQDMPGPYCDQDWKLFSLTYDTFITLKVEDNSHDLTNGHKVWTSGRLQITCFFFQLQFKLNILLVSGINMVAIYVTYQVIPFISLAPTWHHIITIPLTISSMMYFRSLWLFCNFIIPSPFFIQPPKLTQSGNHPLVLYAEGDTLT